MTETEEAPGVAPLRGSPESFGLRGTPLAWGYHLRASLVEVDLQKVAS
jgi:hypothetical protein